jgi:hypothetical protein
MARDPGPTSRLWRGWASGLLLLAATGCANPQGHALATATPPPLPAGEARIWFYRAYEPFESLNLANINVNGSYFGSVANGGAFYRDVPPGHYHVAPASYNRDFDQDKEVDIASGQQLFVKIVSLRNWDGACRNCVRDTFYAWLIRPELAQAEIARDRSGI